MAASGRNCLLSPLSFLLVLLPLLLVGAAACWPLLAVDAISGCPALCGRAASQLLPAPVHQVSSSPDKYRGACCIGGAR